MRDHKRNIINKDSKHSRTRFLNTDAVMDFHTGQSKSAKKEFVGEPVGVGVAMTTVDSAFVKSAGIGGELISVVFKKRPNIVKALKQEVGLTYVSQIPRNIDILVAVKGIGKKSAIHILETLSS